MASAIAAGCSRLPPNGSHKVSARLFQKAAGPGTGLRRLSTRTPEKVEENVPPPALARGDSKKERFYVNRKKPA